MGIVGMGIAIFKPVENFNPFASCAKETFSSRCSKAPSLSTLSGCYQDACL